VTFDFAELVTRKNNKTKASLEIEPVYNWLCERIEDKLSRCENAILVGPPGFGQAKLAKKTAFNLTEKDQEFRVCFIELLSINSRSSFLRQLREEVLRFTNSGEFAKYRKYTHENSYENELLSLPEKVARRKKFKLLICINNIQNITRFPDSEAFQTELRFMNRKRENTVYLLYGHNSVALKTIFQTQYKPLSGFGKLYNLKNTSPPNFEAEIKEHFFNSGKQITPEALKKIHSIAYRHPFYIQLLATHSCWRTEFICTDQTVQASLEGIISQFGPQFQTLLDQLTIKQINYMKALLYQTKGFCYKKNLSVFELGRSSNVTRVRKSLEKKEIIQSFNGETIFIDPILEYWLSNYYFDLPNISRFAYLFESSS
jgi:hypothetical protein